MHWKHLSSSPGQTDWSQVLTLLLTGALILWSISAEPSLPFSYRLFLQLIEFLNLDFKKAVCLVTMPQYLRTAKIVLTVNGKAFCGLVIHSFVHLFGLFIYWYLLFWYKVLLHSSGWLGTCHNVPFDYCIMVDSIAVGMYIRAIRWISESQRVGWTNIALFSNSFLWKLTREMLIVSSAETSITQVLAVNSALKGSTSSHTAILKMKDEV